jgi:hypothetical protein
MRRNKKNKNISCVNKINNDIEHIESIYIRTHYIITDKNYSDLNKTLDEISFYKKHKIIPDNNFWKKLHKLSMNSGGFLSIKNRREIYSFILDTLNLNEKYKIIPEKISQEKYEKDELTVKNDCLRSVFYKIIKEEEKLKKYKEEEKDIIDIYIKELINFTKESLGNYTYFNYYQGYQELCLYFMIIFGRKEGIKYMTIFSKVFLDYVLNKKYQINYSMVIDILNDCCSLINKKVNLIINKITKTKPYYSLPWLITLFTHSNYNLFHEFILLDYFITSNISHIFFLSANIIVNEFNKIATKFNIYNPSDEFMYMEMFLKHFQNLKINLIDLNEILKKNEKINQKYFENIILLTKKKIKNENDQGTLDLLNNKIYDNKIFKQSSIKTNLIFFFISLIILFFAYKYFKYN